MGKRYSRNINHWEDSSSLPKPVKKSKNSIDTKLRNIYNNVSFESDDMFDDFDLEYEFNTKQRKY